MLNNWLTQYNIVKKQCVNISKVLQGTTGGKIHAFRSPVCSLPGFFKAQSKSFHVWGFIFDIFKITPCVFALIPFVSPPTPNLEVPLCPCFFSVQGRALYKVTVHASVTMWLVPTSDVFLPAFDWWRRLFVSSHGLIFTSALSVLVSDSFYLSTCLPRFQLPFQKEEKKKPLSWNGEDTYGTPTSPHSFTLKNCILQNKCYTKKDFCDTGLYVIGICLSCVHVCMFVSGRLRDDCWVTPCWQRKEIQ